jgi:hypothetical protein
MDTPKIKEPKKPKATRATKVKKEKPKLVIETGKFLLTFV